MTAKPSYSDKYRNPSIYVNVRIPYDDYVKARERGINLSEAARTGVKTALKEMEDNQ